MFITLVGELLTQSRTGLLITIIGTLYIFIENYNKKKMLKIIFFSLFGLALLVWYFDLLELILNFGTIGKVASTIGFEDGSSQIRMKYMTDAIEYVSNNPLTLIFGSGYGEAFSIKLIGTPFLEKLIFTVLFQSGFIAFIVVNFVFYFMWKYSNAFSKRKVHNIYSALLYGVKLFIPGFFIANSVGGNSLQTDFIVPFFFFIIGVSIYKLNSGLK